MYFTIQKKDLLLLPLHHKFYAILIYRFVVKISVTSVYSFKNDTNNNKKQQRWKNKQIKKKKLTY